MKEVEFRMRVHNPLLFHLGWFISRVGLHRLGWRVMRAGAVIESHS